MINNTIHIGIMGGMGPQASIKLHQLIIEACTNDLGAKDCDEFPLITHISLPVKDFISDPSARHQNKPMIISALKALAASPLDIAVIACNTAHLLVDDIPELARLPLVSLPESVVSMAESNGTRRLGLLASPTTLQTKLYEKHAARAGIEIIQPAVSDHTRLEQVIRATIAGKNSAHEKLLLRHMIEELLSQGADQVALGCTELSVVMADVQDESIIDSLSATTAVIIGKLSKSEERILA